MMTYIHVVAQLHVPHPSVCCNPTHSPLPPSFLSHPLGTRLWCRATLPSSSLFPQRPYFIHTRLKSVVHSDYSSLHTSATCTVCIRLRRMHTPCRIGQIARLQHSAPARLPECRPDFGLGLSKRGRGILMAFLEYCRTPFTTHVWRAKAPRYVLVVLTTPVPPRVIINFCPVTGLSTNILHVMAVAFRHQTSLTWFIRKTLTKKMSIQPNSLY